MFTGERTPTLKVRGDTDSGKLAKSIAMTLKESANGKVIVRAMGPFAVNQTVKGVIDAKKLLAAEASGLSIDVGWDTKDEEGDNLSLIVFKLTLVQ